MKRKNMLLLLLLMGSFTVGVAQEKASQWDTAFAKDSTKEKISEISNKLDQIYKLQNTIQQTRQSELDNVLNNKKERRRRSDIGIMSDIAKNTEVDFWESGWTFFAIITLFISVITFLAQLRTERHTKNVSIKSQIGMLDDLPRHFYRNLVCTVAMLLKYRHKDNIDTTTNTFKAYPSEANVMKLQTLPEEFILPIDMGTNEIFDEMHEQKLLFKNYNIEVASASEHFSRKHSKEKSLINDYDNLLFKPIFLIKNLCKLYGMLRKNECILNPRNPEYYVCNAISTFVMEHFNKLSFNKISSKIQRKYYCEIKEDNEFKKYIEYDVSTKHDKPGNPIYSNGIERSVTFLLGLLEECELKYFIQIKDGKEYIINQKKFEDFFIKAKWSELNEKKKMQICNDLLMPGDIEEKMKKYKLDKLEDIAYQEAIKSYLEFWQKDEWEVKDLLYNMLKMDAVLELPIIGMIEH